jgi:hypothetical protein
VTIDRFGRTGAGLPKDGAARTAGGESGAFGVIPIAGEVGGGGGMPNSRIRRLTTTVCTVSGCMNGSEMLQA